MPLTRREKAGYATIGTGGALVYGGAQLNERGINNANELTGKQRKALPGLRAWRATKDVKGRGIPRLQMAGGNVGRAVGTAGVIGGVAQVQQGRKWRRDNPNNKIITKSDNNYVREGLKGNVKAVKERAENLKEGKPVGAVALAAGVGAAGSMAGSLATHRKLDKTKRHKALKAKGLSMKNRPGIVAMGGLAGLGASAPFARLAVERKYPEYKVTAAGVTRKKTAPVRPSKMAAFHRPEQRYLSQDIRKNAGLTDRQKRATIFAAGTVPVVGDFAAASAAAKVSNPENRRKAFNTQLAGNLGGSLAGGALGAVAAGEAARRSPVARAKLTQANDWANKKKTAALKPVTDRLPVRDASKPSALNAARSVLAKVPKPKMPGRYAGLGGAVGAGLLGGQMAGGQVGGYKATTINLDRDRKTVAKALVIVNQGQKVDREANDLAARRKKRSARISTVGGTLGVAGFGMMAAAKKPSIAAKYPQLADQARDVGLAGGGVGGANALYYARVQRKEADALKAQRSSPTTKQTFGKAMPSGTDLSVARGLGVLKRPTYRASALVRRQTPSGTLVATRRKASLG